VSGVDNAMDDAPTGDTRVAPDPLTAVMPALAVLGTIASIAAMNWVAEERETGRKRQKRKVAAMLRDLEKCCLGLQAIFEGFHKAQTLFAGQGAVAASPMKFGTHRSRISQSAVRIYHHSINDIASMMVLASQSSFEVMTAIEDGEINPPDEIFYSFGEAQEQLNRILLERETMKSSVEIGLKIAIDLTVLVRKLKEYHAD